MKKLWVEANFPAMDRMGFTNKQEDYVKIERATLRRH